METNIAGIVVIYNPNIKEVIHNICSYLGNIKVLYVIDNSSKNHSEFFTSIDKKIEYISNGKNLGISRALNIGCNLALKQQYDWILTMDQDSRFKDGDLDIMVKFINKVDEKTFIICPEYFVNNKHKKLELEQVKWTITSGQLLKLSFFKKLGPFEEDYFIDQVDFEYCLRGRKEGLNIIRINDIELDHNLGDPRQVNLGVKKINLSNHSPIRKYYFTRNFLYLRKKYSKYFPKLFKYETYIFYKIILKTVLFENNKKAKIHMIWSGYRDYCNNVKGEKVI